ncbi:hypothetical protein FA13DRAFT_841611 [Coprinellus micaceus]|uniref:F-box domain-containing protein n=1 Tax=Coprinellus micaceus TaxID=71717 RepID=A0A4Y7T170_COPMI|nr:hypothetical protein FA13DRAFT_841611 [Coprinellus micaceus]
MGTSKQPSRGYEHLWRSNDPPTDDEDALVRSELQRLRVEFEQLTGRPWMLGVQDVTPPKPVLSKKAQKVHDTIRQHTQLLSCVRRVPTELWGEIFSIALLDIPNQRPGNPYDKALRALCNVCKTWSAAARGHKGLWTKFPTFEFGDTRWVAAPLRQRHQGKVLRQLGEYVEHSGTQPFTFGYILHHERHLLDPYAAFAHAVLKVLVSESRRWEGALIYLASSGGSDQRRWPDEYLAPVKGNVPMLRSLDLTVAAGSTSSWTNTSCIPSLFADSPKLRHVTFNSPEKVPEGRFDVDLPWSQLETFEGLCHTNDSFGQVLANSHSTLRSLKVDIRSVLVPSAPLEPTTMQNLTKLSIRFLSGIDTLYIMFLRLPSLTDLELHGEGREEGISIFRTLVQFIHYSRCSLKRVVVALRLPLPEAGTFEDLHNFLVHCPLLEELDIRASYLFNSHPGERLNPLITVIAGRDLFPHLRVLTLRSDPRDFG